MNFAKFSRKPFLIVQLQWLPLSFLEKILQFLIFKTLEKEKKREVIKVKEKFGPFSGHQALNGSVFNSFFNVGRHPWCSTFLGK